MNKKLCTQLRKKYNYSKRQLLKYYSQLQKKEAIDSFKLQKYLNKKYGEFFEYEAVLKNIMFGSEVADHFLPYVTRNKRGEIVCLGDIGYLDITDFHKFVRICPSIYELDFSGLTYGYQLSQGNSWDTKKILKFLKTYLLNKIIELNLSNTDFDDETMAYLSKHPHLKSLKRLHLSHNDITDTGAIILANSPLLLNLEYLAIEGNEKLGKKGELALINSQFSKNCNFDFDE